MRTWEEVKEWLKDKGITILPLSKPSYLMDNYKNCPMGFFEYYVLKFLPASCAPLPLTYVALLEEWKDWIRASNNNLTEYDVYYKHTKRYLCTVNAHSVKVELIKKEVQKLYPDVELLFYEPDKTRENWLKFYTYDTEIGLRKI